MKDLKLSSPQEDVACSEKQVNLFLAGQGSGKTHVAGVVSYSLISEFPMARGIIAANTYSQLNRSTMLRIREVWKEYFQCVEYDPKTKKGDYVVSQQPPAHFSKEGHNFDSYDNIISFKWGTVVFIGSLDNYKALDGMEVSWAILDETKDTKEEAVKEVIIGRLRQQAMIVNGQAFNPLYIFTSPAKVQWINEWFDLDKFAAEIKSTIYYPPRYFYKEHGNKCVVISATHLNAANLPPNYIANQTANLSKSLQNMLIYADPFSKAGGEFYSGFDRERNVQKVKHRYNPEDVLHLSFDFNVRPYITCTAHQIFERPDRPGGYTALTLFEFCLASPSNRTRPLAKTVGNFFRKRGQTGPLWIYGDPSGKQEDTRSEQGEDDFKLIADELNALGFRLRSMVEILAPAVAMRGQFINTVFENEYEGLEILIDEECSHTIADYLYLKEAADGTKHKEKVTPKGEPGYEKYGHTSDAGDYFHCRAFKPQFQRFKRGPQQGESSVGTREYSSENSY